MSDAVHIRRLQQDVERLTKEVSSLRRPREVHDVWTIDPRDTRLTYSAGVTDHGALGGLGDDDHPQYVLEATALLGATSPIQVDGGAGPVNFSAARTIALASGHGTVTGLTSPRVPYASGASALTDAAGFEYASGNLKVPSGLVVGNTVFTSGYAFEAISLAGGARFARAAVSSGTPKEFDIAGANHTGLSNAEASSFTNTPATKTYGQNNTLSLYRENVFAGATIASTVGTKVITDGVAAQFSAPSAGSNVNISRKTAVYAESGAISIADNGSASSPGVRFGGLSGTRGIYATAGEIHVAVSGASVLNCQASGLTLDQGTARSSGGGYKLNINDSSNHSGLTTETGSLLVDNSPSTGWTYAAGTLANVRLNRLTALQTIKGTSPGTTLTDVSTFEVDDAPNSTGANITLTRRWNTRLPAGNVGIGGSLVVGSVAAAPGTTLDVVGTFRASSLIESTRAAGNPILKAAAFTSDTPATTWTAGVPSANPSGYIEWLVGGTTYYQPLWP